MAKIFGITKAEMQTAIDMRNRGCLLREISKEIGKTEKVISRSMKIVKMHGMSAITETRDPAINRHVKTVQKIISDSLDCFVGGEAPKQMEIVKLTGISASYIRYVYLELCEIGFLVYQNKGLYTINKSYISKDQKGKLTKIIKSAFDCCSKSNVQLDQLVIPQTRYLATGL